MRVYIVAVAVLIAFDILTGCVGALYKKNFKSCRMRDGLYHKFGEAAVLALLYYVQNCIAPDLGVDIDLPLFVPGCGYVAVMEITSIIENLRVYTPGIDNILRHPKKEDADNE